jgi:hypothetical protein
VPKRFCSTPVYAAAPLRYAPHKLYLVEQGNKYMTKKVVTEKEREVRTYAEIWHTSRCLLIKGQEQPKGSHHQFMASLVFTAFTLEAYLNHVGHKLFQCWNDLERLGPNEKLHLIAEHIGLEIQKDRRPWQVMKDLFGFRNDIAHGKSVKLISKVIVSLDEYREEDIPENIPTKWEKYCNQRNAERAREDVEGIILAIRKTAKIVNEAPFAKGMQFRRSSLLDE